MTYEAKLKVQFTTKNIPSVYSSYETEFLPEENYTFEVPAEELSTTQVFGFFKKVMLTMGYSEQTIASGMMSTVFNPDGDEKLMRKLCDEYDLIMAEDFGKRLQEEVQKQVEIEKELMRFNKGPMGTVPEETHATPGSYRKLYQENLDLKARLSRLQNPDAPSYTDEEIDAMCFEEEVNDKYVGKIHEDGVS
jgi:hypothetical protein